MSIFSRKPKAIKYRPHKDDQGRIWREKLEYNPLLERYDFVDKVLVRDPAVKQKKVWEEEYPATPAGDLAREGQVKDMELINKLNGFIYIASTVMVGGWVYLLVQLINDLR